MNIPLSLSIVRTDSSDATFIALVKVLDAVLAELDGPEHEFYAQFHMTHSLRHVVLVMHENKAIGCGAFKPLESGVVEIKRMFVLPAYRGRSVGSFVLTALEAWAAELGMRKCILETGRRQPDAIRLYTKNGYQEIPNYGQYKGMVNSVCFEKLIP
ncbi:MAG TPA: GNAT family N-acetyltransferase [Cyclobacteriaceae bacterium]|nr:GNAT family N-acetyltransferase [Cyclobacteriaceae bacterium]